MAIATTATKRLNVDQTIRLALIRAGMLQGQLAPDPEQLAMGKMFLRDNLDAMQSRGIVVAATDRYEQATIPGQAYIDAPADTVAVDKGAVVRNTNGAEFEMTPLSRLDYQRKVDKAIQGKPIGYYAEQRPDQTFRIFFWLVPDSNWPTVVYPRERRLKDVDMGNADIDVDAAYSEPLGLKLAMEFARTYGRVARQEALQKAYENSIGEASDSDTEHGDAMLVTCPIYPRYR